MRTVIGYLKPFRLRMSIGLIIKISGTVIELALPFILSHILKEVEGMENVTPVLFWGALMVLCAFLACLLNIIANRMAAKVSRHFSEAVRHDLFAHTLALSAAQTDAFTIPSLESRITTDTYNVHHFVGMIQRMGVRAPILLIGGVIITLLMDAYLALVMLAVLPFISVTVYFISKKGVPLYVRVQQAVDKMIRVVREDAVGIRVIKALSKLPTEHRRYDEVNKELVAEEKKAGITMAAVNPVMVFLMNAGITAVVALAAYRVAGHLSDPETVIAFMQYFTLISMAMMTVTRMFVMYTKCAASARRISEVINTKEDLVVESKEAFPDKKEEAFVVFEDVHFAYAGVKKVLEGISFSLKKGQSLGIIGATGSGKSTLVKLLMRFYDPTSGSIRIGGEEVRTMEKGRLAALTGSAMQQDFLYADSIFENIRFGRDLSPEAIKKAAVIAQADAFITSFEEGYDHLLAQKGTNISGGQKQRLLIARAIAAKPDILILDDSSSALDYKTDAALRHALTEEMSGTTLITVAQRVSSVKDCDLILVLEEGRIIGNGKHEELLATCETYKEISDSQMGGAFVE